MTDETIPQPVLFPDLVAKLLVATFDRAHASSDGRTILLKAADRRLQLIPRLAACLSDARDPGLGRAARLRDHVWVSRCERWGPPRRGSDPEAVARSAFGAEPAPGVAAEGVAL